jgi:hypothetical protein
MNVYDVILGSLPLATFKLNSGGTAYVDATNRGAVMTNSPVFAPSILAGSPKSFIARYNTAVAVPSGVWIRGNETTSFTLEQWFLPVFFTGTIAMLSHTGVYDGLSFDGDYIHFKIEFETTGSVDIKWPVPDFPESMHVVGVYTRKRIQLWVQGDLVAEGDISDAQAADGFKTRADTKLYIGESANVNQGGVFDAPTVYARALQQPEISNHFIWGRTVVPAEVASGAYGGNNWKGVSRDIYMTKTWSTVDDWLRANQYSNIDAVDGTLKPANDPTTLLSLAGVWTGTFETGPMGTNAYGIKVEWDGDGSYTVQASLDGGGTWSAALVNGRNIPGTFNWATTDTIVMIRVTFTGGVADDMSTIRNLKVIAYTSPYVYSSSGARTITITDNVATAAEENEPIESNANSGIEIYGGTATITPDTDPTPENINTIELLVKFNEDPVSRNVFSTTGASLLTNSSRQFTWTGMSNVVINRVASSTATVSVVGAVWYHIVATLTTPVNVDIVFGSNGNKHIGLISTFPTALTTAQAQAIFDSHFGYPNAGNIATEDFNFAEAATPLASYAYNWAITAAGG